MSVNEESTTDPADKPTDWDEVQKEDGWWDEALPDATPEERKKEALANAETADDDPASWGKGAERIYAIASTGSEVTPEVFGIGLVGSIIWNSVMGFIIGLLMPTIALSSSSHNLWDFQGAYETLINLGWIIPATTLLGAVYGAWNYGKRAMALRRGKADYLASQEET